MAGLVNFRARQLPEEEAREMRTALLQEAKNRRQEPLIPKLIRSTLPSVFTVVSNL